MNEKQLPSLYSLTQIGIATFLGSALAAGYMLASNYAALGKRRLGIQVGWASLVVVVVFTLIPVDPVTQPGWGIAVVVGQVMLVLIIANQLQGPMLTSFKSMGGEYHPMIRAIAVGFVASFVLMACYLTVIAIFGPPIPAP